jgi:hypothetical protein
MIHPTWRDNIFDTSAGGVLVHGISAGGVLVHGGITQTVVGASVLTWFIRYVFV